MEAINVKSVNKFWNWFQSISDDLLKCHTRSDLISNIGTLVSVEWGFDWEIGPYDDNQLFFCISPGLDNERLEITRQIINLAPKCEDWVFLPSRPVKTWNGIWDINSYLNNKIRIDTNDWDYVLYRFEDGTYDIDIFIPEIDGNIELYEEVVDFALTGYLGEEEYMRLITNVDIVDEFKDDVRSKASKLKFIKEHIEGL